MSARIRGEYWIVDGRADFADGDVGEQNHEMAAISHVCSEHLDAIQDYAEELGISAESSSAADDPAESARSLLEFILGNLFAKADPNNPGLPLYKSDAEIWGEIERRCGLDGEALHVMMSGNYSLNRHSRSQSSIDPRLYVMKKYGWVAVRDNNAEMFGYDPRKKKELADGIDEILEQEGVEEPDEEVELNVYDHKTGRSFDVTLADLKGESSMRPQTLPNTTYNRPLFVPPDRSGPMGSNSPRQMDAKTRSALQTSECEMGFKDWLSENCGPLIVRRSWPSMTGGDGEVQGSPASRRSRRGRRR